MMVSSLQLPCLVKTHVIQSTHTGFLFFKKKKKKTVKVTPTWITSPEAPSRATDEYYTTVLTSDTYPPHVKSVSSLCETFIP